VRFSLENQLRNALVRSQLSLHYQPKVDVASGLIVGAEALMRWEHPQLGFVLPDRFIAIAEESGLIESLGRWALMTACLQNRKWMQAGFEPIRIAVNVSPIQLRSADILETVYKTLQNSRMDPRQLVVEVTESGIMSNPAAISRLFDGLKDLGVRISVDDFGTGYSSLAHLKRFPIDELKIDRAFLEGIPNDPENCSIVTAIIAMAHSLGLTVVAEGVEDSGQLAFLAELGCDTYQGYFCSRPVKGADWPLVLSAGTPSVNDSDS
jgi:EAL domain-containing protein (putative c-di-GMP-specific phosphodiesterase class I)